MFLSQFTSKRQKIVLTVLVFFLAWIWQSIDINAEGRTWDEEYKVDMGYEALINLNRGDFSFASWNNGTEHPMVAKYFYTFAALPQITTVDVNKPLDFSTQMRLATGKNYLYRYKNVVMIIDYDYTLPRLLSSAFNATTVALVFLIASMFLAPLPSIFAALTLLTTPRFLAMGRLITYESLSGALYVIIGIVFAYLLARKQQITRWYLFVGLLAGLLLWTRYNNIYVFFLIGGWWIMRHWLHSKDKKHFLFNKSLYRWQLFIIPVSALLVGFAIWPLLWMDFPKNFINTFSQNGNRVSPFLPYYYIQFFYTTPIPYLFLFTVGIIYAIKKHIYYFLVLLWALLSMIIFYTIFAAAGGGTRYIFSIYPVYALFCGIGLQSITQWISKKNSVISVFAQASLGGIIVIFIFISSVFMIHPYYLDYYNELAGGLQGAVDKNLAVSWWGEGQREAGLWLEAYSPADKSVALKVTPMYVFPPLRRDLKVYPYNTHIGETDFLIVTRGDLSSIKNILPRYKKVYSVARQGVDLIVVFKRI